MKIEIRKVFIIVDGVEKFANEVFMLSDWNWNKHSYLDFRRVTKLNLAQVPEIEFINKSGRNIHLVGMDGWHCTLKTSQGIKAEKGVMKYMSQYSI